MVKLPKITKRQKFFLATIFLILGIIFTRLDFIVGISWRMRTLAFGATALITTILALRDEDFSGIEWIVLPILPVFLSIGTILVYPLLPQEINQFFLIGVDADGSMILTLTLKVLYLAIFGIGYYAALLTSNIFNVAGLRTIQLIRVAHSIGFLLTLVSALLLFMVIYSLHLSGLLNLLAVFSVSFPLILQSVWSLDLEEKLSGEVIRFSFAIAWILAQFGLFLSFWPIPIFVFALFLTATVYLSVGVVQYHLMGRLKMVVIQEHAIVLVVFLILTIISAAWTG